MLIYTFQADKPAEAESKEEKKAEKEEDSEEKEAEGDKNDNASTEATGIIKLFCCRFGLVKHLAQCDAHSHVRLVER